jgi:hypothetical protein
MISGITSRFILGLLSLALGMFVFVVPTLKWLMPESSIQGGITHGASILELGHETPWETAVNEAIFDGFPRWLMILSAGIGVYALIRSVQLFKQIESLLRQQRQENGSSEDRFDELERLKRRDLVTPEEYAAKRQEILKDL